MTSIVVCTALYYRIVYNTRDVLNGLISVMTNTGKERIESGRLFYGRSRPAYVRQA